MSSRILPLLLAGQLCASALAATPLHPAYDLQGPGLAVAHGGVGFLDVRSRNLVIHVGGPVELALLYWTGRDRPCEREEPEGPCVVPETGLFKDQQLRFQGALVNGELIGSEFQPDTNAGPINNIGYVADVTETVADHAPGRQVYPVSDGDPANNLADLDGAGLLVVYRDPAVTRPARVIVYHGLDFAYGEDRTHGETQVTDPFSFNHGAARTSVRRGRLVIFAGDAVDFGPDRIDIGHNPSPANQLNGSSGKSWDADAFQVDVPARVAATTVQLFSEPIGLNPDSFLWVMAALWLPLPVPSGCSDTFWGASLGLWGQAGTKPVERVVDVFSGAKNYGAAGNVPLRTAIRFRSGGDLLGAARGLVRVGLAALLNAGHPAIEFPLTRTQVITGVDTALLSKDTVKILALTDELKAANGAGCPLD
ncbi:MAG TPA: hypothetical protein VLE27_15545 [Thermoanaerobaculia bacterium]|nr:hypothetical protein [Thermoanaerobaculia bacterium]